MTISWNDALSTGIAWQDAQHKELVKKTNELMNAMMQGKGAEEVDRIFRFLDEYVTVHFGAEEEAMLKYSYPMRLPTKWRIRRS